MTTTFVLTPGKATLVPNIGYGANCTVIEPDPGAATVTYSPEGVDDVEIGIDRHCRQPDSGHRDEHVPGPSAVRWSPPRPSKRRSCLRRPSWLPRRSWPARPSPADPIHAQVLREPPATMPGALSRRRRRSTTCSTGPSARSAKRAPTRARSIPTSATHREERTAKVCRSRPTRPTSRLPTTSPVSRARS